MPELRQTIARGLTQFALAACYLLTPTAAIPRVQTQQPRTYQIIHVPAAPVIPSQNNYEQQLLKTVNKVVVDLTNALERHHTPYNLGNVNGINCSRFVMKATLAVMAKFNQSYPDTFNIPRVQHYMEGSSENQVLFGLGQSDKTPLKYFTPTSIKETVGNDLVQPGMIVGLAFERFVPEFAQGRTNGIEHVGIVVKLPDGTLSIADMSSQFKAKITPIQEWVDRMTNLVAGGARFYIADPFTQAADPKADPKIVYRLASAPIGDRAAIDLSAKHRQFLSWQRSKLASRQSSKLAAAAP